MPKPKSQDMESAEGNTSEGTPKPTFEEPEGQQSSPLDAKAFEERFDQLNTRLDEMDRRWQSDKDRRLPKLESEVSEIRTVLGDYRKLIDGGVDEELAGWLVERLAGKVDDVDRRSQPHAKASDGTDVSEQATATALGKLEKHGLSANDPEFIEILRGQYRNVDAFNARVSEYILDKKDGATSENVSALAGASQGAATEEQETEPENPIEDIEDSRDLYDMAWKDIKVS